MNKEQYAEIEMNVIVFENKDVLTDSYGDFDPDDPGKIGG